MNILVSPYGEGSFYFRSDSTLIRMLTDFYMPDYIDSISAVPALFIRSCRSGKAVQSKFIYRYFGPFSCGLLLKASTATDKVSGPDSIFVQNALDYSTVVPYDLIPIEKLDGFISGQRPFEIKVNGIGRAEIKSCPELAVLCSRAADISRYCSVRTGDFFAFELGDPVPVGKNERVTAHFGIEGNIGIIVK